MRVWCLVAQECDEFTKTLGTIGSVGVVLDVSLADVLERGLGILLVEALLVELQNGLAIGFLLWRMRLSPRRGRRAEQSQDGGDRNGEMLDHVYFLV